MDRVPGSERAGETGSQGPGETVFRGWAYQRGIQRDVRSLGFPYALRAVALRQRPARTVVHQLHQGRRHGKEYQSQ
ncbi:MAG: hypothetical protein IKH63_09410 [Prevotella sp.]|nr:hypothetical protein [Prevotella sp.]